MDKIGPHFLLISECSCFHQTPCEKNHSKELTEVKRVTVTGYRCCSKSVYEICSLLNILWSALSAIIAKWKCVGTTEPQPYSSKPPLALTSAQNLNCMAFHGHQLVQVAPYFGPYSVYLSLASWHSKFFRPPYWGCIFCVRQVINGLLERPDWEEAIRTPLGILPGGSGNALAASIHHYSGWGMHTHAQISHQHSVETSKPWTFFFPVLDCWIDKVKHHLKNKDLLVLQF